MLHAFEDSKVRVTLGDNRHKKMVTHWQVFYIYESSPEGEHEVALKNSCEFERVLCCLITPGFNRDIWYHVLPCSFLSL